MTPEVSVEVVMTGAGASRISTAAAKSEFLTGIAVTLAVDAVVMPNGAV
jgi:hypothetical protein